MVGKYIIAIWLGLAAALATNALAANTLIDPADPAFGGNPSDKFYTVQSNGTTTLVTNGTDFGVNQGIWGAHLGVPCHIGSTPCTAIAIAPPNVLIGKCSLINQASPYVALGWAADIGMFFDRNNEPLYNKTTGGAYSPESYSVSNGQYQFWDDHTPEDVCYALNSVPAGPNSISVRVSVVDTDGSISHASPPTTVAGAAFVFPTLTTPVLVYEGTPVPNAAGYLFYESINNQSWFPARLVWINDPVVNNGASIVNAGRGYVDWGLRHITDPQIPNSPPDTDLNASWFSKVTSMSGANLVVSTAPSVTGAVVVGHDNKPALDAVDQYCHNQPGSGCRIRFGAGNWLFSKWDLTQPNINSLDIEGMGVWSTNLKPFGWGDATYCTRDNGGQIHINGPSVNTGNNFTIWSQSSVADCIAMIWSGTWTPLNLENYWAGAPGSSNHRGIVWGDGGGSISGTFQNTEQNVDFGNSVNGVIMGIKYSGGWQIWPGPRTSCEVGFSGGSANITFNTWVFENSWGALCPDGLPNWGNQGSGGYIQGLSITNPYISDMGYYSTDDISNGMWINLVSCSASGQTVTCTTATAAPFIVGQQIYVERTSNGGNNNSQNGNWVVSSVFGNSFSFIDPQGGSSVGGDAKTLVQPHGTFFTSNGNNWSIQDSTLGIAGNIYGEGVLWAQTYVAGNYTTMKNIGSATGAFGAICDGNCDIENNQFDYLQSNSVCIAESRSGSRVQGNRCTGVNGSVNKTAYQLGYSSNNTTMGCDTADPFYLSYNTGLNYLQQFANAGDKVLNLCPTSTVK